MFLSSMKKGKILIETSTLLASLVERVERKDNRLIIRTDSLPTVCVFAALLREVLPASKRDL